jgi:hypothetical protein
MKMATVGRAQWVCYAPTLGSESSENAILVWKGGSARSAAECEPPVSRSRCMLRVNVWRRVRREGRQAAKTRKTAISPERANRRADLVDRKVKQPSEDQNVGNGFLPNLGNWERDQG